jgi:cytochrome c556
VVALLATVPLTACFKSHTDEHPNQVLSKRKTLFKQLTRTMEPITLVANDRKDYDKAEFLAQVQDLEKLSAKPWAYFPLDGNYPPTHAKPTVWEKPAEFKQAQEHYLAAVGALVTAAQGGDLAKIKTAVGAVNNSCKACHTDFRYNL